MAPTTRSKTAKRTPKSLEELEANTKIKVNKKPGNNPTKRSRTQSKTRTAHSKKKAVKNKSIEEEAPTNNKITDNKSTDEEIADMNGSIDKILPPPITIVLNGELRTFYPVPVAQMPIFSQAVTYGEIGEDEFEEDYERRTQKSDAYKDDLKEWTLHSETGKALRTSGSDVAVAIAAFERDRWERLGVVDEDDERTGREIIERAKLVD
jgi:hypothetical protein